MFMGLAGTRQTAAKRPSEMHLSQSEKGTSFCQLKKQKDKKYFTFNKEIKSALKAKRK